MSQRDMLWSQNLLQFLLKLLLLKLLLLNDLFQGLLALTVVQFQMVLLCVQKLLVLMLMLRLNLLEYLKLLILKLPPPPPQIKTSALPKRKRSCPWRLSWHRLQPHDAHC